MATEQTIDQCIHMIAVNWRRTQDTAFYEQSFPSYWAAFKDIDDQILLSAVNNFICECLDKFQPPFGIVRQHVLDTIGIKEAKERKALQDCENCEAGFREVSFISRNDQGRYAMKLFKCACCCPAGNQRVTGIGGINMLQFGDLMTKLQGDERIIQIWHTSKNQPTLPLVALPAYNPLILKQVEEAAERRKSKTGLGSAMAERRRQLKRMGR